MFQTAEARSLAMSGTAGEAVAGELPGLPFLLACCRIVARNDRRVGIIGITTGQEWWLTRTVDSTSLDRTIVVLCLVLVWPAIG